MTEKQGQIVYRSLHAPKESGVALIEPPIGEFAAQIRQFYQSPSTATRVCWKVKEFWQHKILARHELAQLLRIDPEALSMPIVMVGHQPQLFHPGVWMKNFVADRLAKVLGGTAINLMVDNDLFKAATIAIPSRESEGTTAQCAFDRQTDEMPYEERTIVDYTVMNSFAERTAQEMHPVTEDRLIENYWPRVLSEVDQATNLGSAFSAVRNQFEIVWNANVHDVPLSRLVGGLSFAMLALEIARDSLGFAKIYNASLAEYREVHGLRSRSHPAPDLEIVSEDEIELPFWLWSGAAPRRKRTFIRRKDSQFLITDRESIEWSGSFKEGRNLPKRFADELLVPTSDAIRPKLRPKALITTLYARLLLCDGFVHGIGGAKYDQVTEAIAARWGLGTLAPMQCATMTLRFPLPMEVIPIEEVRRRKRKLRDLRYHPEKFLSEATLSADLQGRANELSQQKQQWLSVSAPEQLRDRHHAIQAINLELHAMLNNVRARSEAYYQEGLARFTAQQPWLSREFAAVLFPEEMLKAEFARVVAE